MKSNVTEIKVGDRIRILHLRDEDGHYDDRQGIVEFIDGLGQLHGTWDGLAVIPEVDSFELVSGNVKP